MLENNVRYYAWRIIKVDLSKYGDAEKVIIKAFERNEFEKFGVRETCRRIEEKHGYSVGATKKTYANMKKYGAFEHLFPERYKVNYVSFATRLKSSNIDKLKELAHHRKHTRQEVINNLIEEAHNQTKWIPSK